MGQIVTRPITGTRDGQVDYDPAPATLVLTGATLDAHGNPDWYKWILRFPFGLPPTATVTSATLTVTAAASHAGGDTLTIGVRDTFATGDIVPTDYTSVADIDTDTLAGPAVASGASYDLDVTGLVLAAMADAGYPATGAALTFVVASDGATHRTIRSFEGSVLERPRLTVEFTVAETDADPVRIAIHAVWELLEANYHFGRLVSTANRIKMLGTDPYQDKALATDADFPLVRVRPTELASHQVRDSSNSTLKVTLAIDVASGDQRIDAVWSPVAWAIYRALANWRDATLKHLWSGLRSIVAVKLTGGATNLDTSGAEMHTLGWLTVWTVEIELAFSTPDLLK